jgi:hypothetical protein
MVILWSRAASPVEVRYRPLTASSRPVPGRRSRLGGRILPGLHMCRVCVNAGRTAFVINLYTMTCAAQMRPGRAPEEVFPRRYTSVCMDADPFIAFGPVDAGEDLAATGRVRDKFLHRRVGLAARRTLAYVPLHRV